MPRNFFKVKLEKSGKIKLPKKLINYLSPDNKNLFLVPTNGVIQITNSSNIFIPIMKKERDSFIPK